MHIQVESLEAENQRRKEEVEDSKEEFKERAEGYERIMGEQKQELESYKREMKKNQELIEQSFVEGDALVKKNSLLHSKTLVTITSNVIQCRKKKVAMRQKFFLVNRNGAIITLGI